MLPDQKKKAQAALKRLNGLSKKVEDLMEEGECCTEVLRNVLAMKGHLDHIQGKVLESHLLTCAQKKLSSETEKEAFVQDLMKAVGLSTR